MSDNPSYSRSKRIPVKPYGIRELAELYNVSTHTVKRWIGPFSEELGPRIGHYYTAKQIRIIFSKIGLPTDYEE